MKPARRGAANWQRGVAVVTAILVVALVASVTAYLTWQNQLRIRQAENLKAQIQADALALANADWRRALLAEDAAGNNVDHLGESWAAGMAPLITQEGEIGGQVTDQQGLFNLNNLVRGAQASEPDIARFRRLLDLLRLPGNLANAVADWIDQDSEVRYPGGAEDTDYLLMEPAYRAANQPLTDVAGLFRVKGFDSAAIERLRPFVSALPDATTVNLNTAPAPVLAAMLDDGTMDDTAAIIAARRGRPFASWQDFAARLPDLARRTRQDAVGVNSRFFLNESQARYGPVIVRWQMLLRRAGGGRVDTVWQKRL